MQPQDPARITPIMESLKALWLDHPHLTFGQLVSIVDDGLFGKNKACLFYADDSDVLASIVDMAGYFDLRQKAKEQREKDIETLLTSE